VSQRLPKHLVSFLKAPGLLRMNQLGHTHVDAHFLKRPVLKLCRTYAGSGYLVAGTVSSKELYNPLVVALSSHL
jgi:hypothetical protein